MPYVSFDNVPLYASYGTAANDVRTALVGDTALAMVVVGDSNETPSAAGGVSQASRNLSLVPHTVNPAGVRGIRSSGWCQSSATSSSNWTARAPIRHATTGGGGFLSDARYTTWSGANAAKATAYLASMPAGWAFSSYNTPRIVNSTATNSGMFCGLQAYGDNYPPELGVAGPGVQLWTPNDTDTYIDIVFQKCSLSGFAAEAVIRVTPTDTLNGAVAVSAVQTFTTGSGGVPSLALTTGLVDDGSGGVVDSNNRAVFASVRIGPLSFTSSSVLRRCCQVNIGGSGGDVIVCGYRFVRPSMKGLSFEQFTSQGSYSALTFITNHGSSQAAFQAFAGFDSSERKALWIQAGVNSCYVDSAVADDYANDTATLINFLRSWFGDSTMPVVVSVPPYRDNGSGTPDARDPEFDLYADAAYQATLAGTFGNAIFLNTRRATDALGCNRANENISALTRTTEPGVNMSNIYNQWDPTSTFTANDVINCGPIPVPIRVRQASGTLTHPLGTVAPSSALYHGAVRNWCSTNSDGSNDTSHFSPHGMRMLRQVETDLLVQAALNSTPALQRVLRRN